jgi:cobalt-zinc-cadmium efflux system outer membrane protein
MRLPRLCIPVLLVTVFFFEAAAAQSPPVATTPPQAQALAQSRAAVKISLDDAIQRALQHNHTLLAARTTIQQSQAEETTANLRPNPVLLGDAQFLPIFQPTNFNSDYIDNTAQFDLGVSYLFERGKKRQHRVQAARDVTAVTRSQVADVQCRVSVRQC